MLNNLTTHYGTTTRLLHWGMAFIIIAGLASVELHEFFPKGSDIRSALMTTHFQIGLIVFALVWLRIARIVLGKTPAITPEPPRWQVMAAKLVHLAFYSAMIVLPVLGVLMLQSGDKAVTLLGMPLPTFIGVDKEFSKALKEVHEIIGNIVIGLIFAHVAAAVWHHRVQRDNTLLRMLPSQ